MRPHKITRTPFGACYSFLGRTFVFYLLSGHWQLSAVVPSLEAEAGVHAGIRPIEVLSQTSVSQFRQWIFFDFETIIAAFSAYAGVDGDMAGDFT